jgi:hypothetical protein
MYGRFTTSAESNLMWKNPTLTCWKNSEDRAINILRLRFDAFPATEYDEVFSGYQPGQMVERWKKKNVSKTISVLIILSD